MIKKTKSKKVYYNPPLKSSATRTDILQEMTRGLEMPEDQTWRAKESFFAARDQFVKHAIALNYTDTEICRTLKITGHTLHNIKARIFQNEVESLTKMTQLEHFVEYRLKQMEVIKDLDVLIEQFRAGKNLQGLSSALKAKTEALKELKEAAQEVGLLDRKPEEVILVNGVNVKELSNADLMDKITDGYKTIHKLMDNVLPFKPTPKGLPTPSPLERAAQLDAPQAPKSKLKFRVKAKS